jgi:hypothetical protein
MGGLHHLYPPGYVAECILRPSTPLFRNRDELGVKIRFESGVYDSILSPIEFNCELRPAMIECASIDGSDFESARSDLRDAVVSWRARFSENRSQGDSLASASA